MQLYGDPYVRETADTDLHVVRSARAATATVLAGLGWRHRYGDSPWEEAWMLERDGQTFYLDVHSRLLDHNLAHLPDPAVERAPCVVEGRELPAHAGALVPAFLASHASKHRLPPLLWFVDFQTLWAGLDEQGRSAARAAARAHRLERYLDWAIEGGAAVRAAAEEPASLRRVGVSAAGRRDDHPARRDLELAASRLDAVRAALAWAWPPPERAHPLRFARRLVSRAAHLRSRAALAMQEMRRSGSATAAVAREASRASVVVEGAENVIAIVRASLEMRGDVWLSCSGGSMWPTVRDGDEVLVAPIDRPVRRGEVVLVGTARGLTLHRVVATEGDAIRAAGDASRCEDPPCSRSSVIARAIAVRGHHLAALTPTLRFGILPAVRWLFARARLASARAYRRIARRRRGAPGRSRPASLGGAA
jgi:hypothetical protein